ncbi:Retrotransposon gag domain-containing protein [Forsythia ovata]|uniref:Retrotransposon gag domain-containing protein n=1 Tax=Forsythia ovata TaxID=205694 RepID=A0ABD1VHF7_9LAMI
MDCGTSNVPLTEDATTGSLPFTESVAVTGVLNSLPTLLPIAMKLGRSNYNFWKSQIMPTLRAYDLKGFITGSMACPQKVIEARSADTVNKDTSEDRILDFAASPRMSQPQNPSSPFSQPQESPQPYNQPQNPSSSSIPSAASTHQQDSPSSSSIPSAASTHQQDTHELAHHNKQVVQS